MAGNDASFTLNLDGNLEDGADSSEESLERLRRSILDTTQDLGRMQAALNTMKKGGLQSSAAFQNLSAQVEVHKKAIAGAQAKYIDLGGEFGKLDPPTAQLSFMDELMTQIDTSALAVVGAVAAVVAVLGALAVGLVAAAAKLTMFAISSSDAARSLNITLDALLGSSNAATSLQAAISRVASSTSIGRDEITGFAKQLAQAGIRGAQLEDALQAVSNAASVGGDTGKIVAQLSAAKSNAVQFNKVLDKTNGLYGELAGKSALGFGAQMNRLKESIGELFSGLDLEPFLKALRSITKLFDSNTVAGKSLKTIVTAIFQPLITGAAAAAPKVVWAFKEAIIWAQRVVIAVLKTRNAIRDALAGPNAGPIKAALVGILIPLALIAIAATATVTAMVIGFALVAAAVALVLLPFALMGAAIWYIVDAASTFGSAVSDGVGAATDAVKAKASEWLTAGKNFVTGLVNGIKSGLADVVAAAKSVAEGAVNAARSIFQEKSPSRVMMQVGSYASEGMAIGLEDGTDMVEASTAKVVQAAIPDPDAISGAANLGGAAGGKGSGGSGVAITINNPIFGGEMDPASMLAMLTKMLEDAARQAGLNPEPEPV